MEESPSIISHISLGTNNARSRRCFLRSHTTYPWLQADYGTSRCSCLWQTLSRVLDTGANRRPTRFRRQWDAYQFPGSNERMYAFYEAALAAGAIDEGAPGPRPDYGEPYYGCFVRDPDGHKVEASFWDMELVQSLYMERSDSP